MHSFTERMKTMSEAILTSRRERCAAVAGVKEHTEQVLSEAEVFLQRLNQEHRDLAARTRSELASNRRDRSEQLRQFRDDVRRGHQETRDRLRQMLGNVRHVRQEHVGQLRQSFNECQRHLADDLREASRLWQQVQHDGVAEK